ncbi:hypothetical protein RSAG8_09648, partial [Rhizoctonia solani AG-8 WAC10335]
VLFQERYAFLRTLTGMTCGFIRPNSSYTTRKTGFQSGTNMSPSGPKSSPRLPAKSKTWLLWRWWNLSGCIVMSFESIRVFPGCSAMGTYPCWCGSHIAVEAGVIINCFQNCTVLL